MTTTTKPEAGLPAEGSAQAGTAAKMDGSTLRRISEALKTEIEELVPTMQGWCWVGKALAMANLIVQTRPKVVVEIGAFGGRSLVPQALALRELYCEGNEGEMQFEKLLRPAQIYGIDPWSKAAVVEGENAVENDEWWMKVDMGAIFSGLARQIHRSGLSDWISLLKLPSEQAAPVFVRIDILHIDGNHSEKCSCRDVTLYMPKVPSGGYVWVDDSNWASVQAARDMVEGVRARGPSAHLTSESQSRRSPERLFGVECTHAAVTKCASLSAFCRWLGLLAIQHGFEFPSVPIPGDGYNE